MLNYNEFNNINEGSSILFKQNYFKLNRKTFIYPDNDDLINVNDIEFALNENLYNILMYTSDDEFNKKNNIKNKEFKIFNNTKNINLADYKSYFFIEKNSSDYSYIIFNLLKDNIHYEVRISIISFKKYIKNQETRKSGDHENYQILGFYYDTTKFNNILSNNIEFNKLDFKQNILDINDDDLNNNKNNILGSVLFKLFLENKIIENNSIKNIKHKKDFYIKDVLSNIKDKRLNNFLSSLNKSENNELTKNFYNYQYDFKNLKNNTADCILTNFEYDNSFDTILENSIIISQPTDYSFRKYIEYWNDICYIISNDDFIDAIDNALSIKEKTDLNFYFKDVFQSGYYNNIVNKIFKYLDINNKFYPAFVLVSLKKDKLNCQLGKATMIFKELFPDDKIEENILSDLYSKIESKISNIFNKIKNLFTRKNQDVIDNIISDISNIDDINLTENINFNYSDLENKVYFYKDKIAVYIESQLLNTKITDKHLQFKLDTSRKIDKYLDKILNIVNKDTLEMDNFNRKFSMIISNALLGDTNLPMYIVYGYNDKNKNPFITYSLHKMKIKKEQSHIESISQYKDLPYIIHIRNYHNEKNEFLYKSVDIYIFNYKTRNEDIYFCLRLGTKSSSHSSFAVETLPVSYNTIKNIKKEINSLKS